MFSLSYTPEKPYRSVLVCLTYSRKSPEFYLEVCCLYDNLTSNIWEKILQPKERY
jgi:hypothetical protein